LPLSEKIRIRKEIELSLTDQEIDKEIKELRNEIVPYFSSEFGNKSLNSFLCKKIYSKPRKFEYK
jgi:hypothetical protein